MLFRSSGGLLQELTAIYPYDVLQQMYEEAVNDEPYSFLFNLKAPKEKMFSIRFHEILQVENNDGELPDLRHGNSEAPTGS